MFQRMWLLVVALLMTGGALFLVAKFSDREEDMIIFLGSVLFSMMASLFIAFTVSHRQSLESLFCLKSCDCK